MRSSCPRPVGARGPQRNSRPYLSGSTRPATSSAGGDASHGLASQSRHWLSSTFLGPSPRLPRTHRRSCSSSSTPRGPGCSATQAQLAASNRSTAQPEATTAPRTPTTCSICRITAPSRPTGVPTARATKQRSGETQGSRALADVSPSWHPLDRVFWLMRVSLRPWARHVNAVFSGVCGSPPTSTAFEINLGNVAKVVFSPPGHCQPAYHPLAAVAPHRPTLYSGIAAAKIQHSLES